MESPRRTSYKLWSARWALNPYSKWEAGAWTVGFLHPWCSFHVSTFRLWLVLDLWVSWMAPSTEAMNVIIKWSKSLKNYGGDTCNGRRRIRSGRDRSGYALHSLALVLTTWRWQANESHLVCQNIYASFALTLISLQFLWGFRLLGHAQRFGELYLWVPWIKRNLSNKFMTLFCAHLLPRPLVSVSACRWHFNLAAIDGNLINLL